MTLYGGLHGFYVVIIWLIFEETFYFDYAFIGMITFAYMALFFSKYTLSRVVKLGIIKEKYKVRFVRAIKDLEQADRLLSVSKVEINDNIFMNQL